MSMVKLKVRKRPVPRGITERKYLKKSRMYGVIYLDESWIGRKVIVKDI